MPAIRHVIWDFNGTLFDDVDCCVDTVNTLLVEHARPALTRDEYLGRFGFPVQQFYAELGFDLDAKGFEDLSHAYIERYLARLGEAAPRPDAVEAIELLHARGLGQSVLSAMETGLLEQLLGRMGLRHRLSRVRGLDDFRAHSKAALGVALAREIALMPEELLLVGDTLHDFEVAQEIGCACVLYARGHQAPERLVGAGVPIVQSLVELDEMLERTHLTSR